MNDDMIQEARVALLNATKELAEARAEIDALYLVLYATQRREVELTRERIDLLRDIEYLEREGGIKL